ncbi:MAG: glycosyltransferase family 2 protein [Acidobacteria bacterium]|nr:glycosyltransferase family 2 protein [Acidobacteriota bacterium]
MKGGEMKPRLTGVVIHWHGEELLDRLRRAWPNDPRFELLVVDNGSSRSLEGAPGRVLSPGCNLGFAGAANLGLEEAQGEVLLLLNPDALPETGALEALLEGFERWPDAAGLAPRLLGDDGTPQHRWQLRPLPRPSTLLLQLLLIPAGEGAADEPPPGTAVEQPAAAALAFRRSVLEELGGLDAGFYPAWFEDVDLARRLRDSGQVLRYCPEAVFRHGLGASVPRMGYGPFLWVYYRNLLRYLRLHHGAGWTTLAKPILLLGMSLRLLLLPLRRPRRAKSRREAARGLLAVIAGVVSGWRRPHELTVRFSPPRATT